MKIAPHACHDLLVKKTLLKLAFDKTLPFAEWKNTLRNQFLELIAMEKVRGNTWSLNFEINRRA